MHPRGLCRTPTVNRVASETMTPLFNLFLAQLQKQLFSEWEGLERGRTQVTGSLESWLRQAATQKLAAFTVPVILREG